MTVIMTALVAKADLESLITNCQLPMPSPYLTQLQTDHTDLTRILQYHQNNTHPRDTPSGRILRGIYLMILEDALKVVNSLLQIPDL